MNWNHLLQAGVAKGILPATAIDHPAPAAPHPWPLVLMSFFGALFAAVPIVAFLGLLLGSTLMQDGIAAYLTGALVAGGCCAVLCAKRLPLFVESLALTFMLAGLCLLFFAVLRDLPRFGYWPCALIALGLAALVPVRWVQSLLAAIAAGMCFGAVHEFRYYPLLYLSLALVLVWLAGLWLQQHLLATPDQAQHAIALEWLLGGWIMLVLVATVLLPEVRSMFNERIEDHYRIVRSLGAVASLVASAWAWRSWPGLRGLSGSGLLAVLVGLSWFMPTLGPVAAIGLVALTTARFVQAGTAALAAAWVVGHFYYVLQWSLVTKAQVLVVAGLVLVALAWWARPRQTDANGKTAAPATRAALLLATLGTLATLAVVNLGIWQKEDIIAHGRPVFIKLAPVDPRSLMQGDYMALNFEMTNELRNSLHDRNRLERPTISGNIDARGVFSLDRLATNSTPGGEFLIELSPSKRGWVVVSDAWFFKEGDGARWSKARYGEFRVMPDGSALLVGMADDNLQPIQP